MMADQQRYPVAERNRRAKMRFLEGLKSYYEGKRKTSVESLQSESAKSVASAVVPKVDLTVPGTPVSSRYLRLRRESESQEVEPVAQVEPVPLPSEFVVSSLVIDKFLKDMKGLGGEVDGQEQHAEVVNLNSDGSEEEEESKVDGDVAEQYFKESEEKHTYHRTFSEAVQTLHSSEVKSPVVKRYFEESSAKHTYARDFNEAVNELNPAVLEDDPLRDDSAKITKGYKSSVPGTPISSKHLDRYKKRNYISDSSDDEDGDDTTDSRKKSSLADPLDKFIKEMEALNAEKPNLSNVSKRRDNPFSVNEYLNVSETKKSYARTFSQAVQTLYSTEVKDPNIKDYFEQSEAKKTFRREFSEVYQEIKREEPPLHPLKPEVVEQVEQKKDTEKVPERYESLEQLLGTFVPPKIEKKPVLNDFSVNSYMTSSDANKSYARSFSQAVQTLHTTDVKDPSVREYFDQSVAKNAFRREFSEVYREVDVKEIARDIPPSKPASSDQQQKDNKQSENPISRSNAADGLPPVDVPQKHLPQRSISVPGTPINSRKLNPREKPPRSVQAKPDSTYAKTEVLLSPRLQQRKQRGLFNVEHYFAARLFRRARSVTDDPESSRNGDVGGGLNDDKLFSLAGDGEVAAKLGSQSEMSAMEHADNTASAAVRGRAVSAAENNMDKAFWMSFGSS